MSATSKQLEHLADSIRPDASFQAALQAERVTLHAILAAEVHVFLSDVADHVEGIASTAGVVLNEAPSLGDSRLVQRILNLARIREFTSARLTPVFSRAWQRALRSTVEVFRNRDALDKEIGSLERQVLRMGGLRSGLVGIEGDTKRALFKALEVAADRDLTIKQTVGMIRDYVPGGRFINAGNTYRASMIARSEMRSAQNFAVAELTRPGLLVASDGTGDEACATRDGQVFAPDEAIQEDASTHPNCVLSFAPAAT